MKLTPAKKLFITGVMLMFIIAMIAGAYVLTYRRIRTLASELDELHAKIESQHKEQQHRGSLAAILQNHRDDFDRLRSFRISRTNPAPFFKDIETLAARTHTTITIHVNNTGAAADILAFGFTIEGAEENVAALLAFIEHVAYDLTIDDIAIQKIPSGQKEAQMSGPSSIRLLISVHVKASS